MGAIVFSPLGQGMLTDRYLDGIPEDSRAARDGSLSKSMLSDENLARVRALNEIAQRRGQTLAQLALAWTLRDPRVTSTLIGASSVEQLEDNVGALERLDFDDDELAELEKLRGGRRDQHLGAVELRVTVCLAVASAALRGAQLHHRGEGCPGACACPRVSPGRGVPARFARVSQHVAAPAEGGCARLTLTIDGKRAHPLAGL